ncbi:hypothetical protein LCGC14_3099400 [marine sediment metagenome]|uniref:Uncharacterized protein n=1 Tax=marine sediment metagenome TaxID=412755 RepID=A0A0F8WX18_9ZZZZ
MKKYQVKAGVKVWIDPSIIVCAWQNGTLLNLYIKPNSYMMTISCMTSEEATKLLELIEKDLK